MAVWNFYRVRNHFELTALSFKKYALSAYYVLKILKIHQ